MIKKLEMPKGIDKNKTKNLNVGKKISIPLRRNSKRLILFCLINSSPILNIKELNSNKSSFVSRVSRENKDNQSCCFSFIFRDNKRFLKVTTLINSFFYFNKFGFLR